MSIPWHFGMCWSSLETHTLDIQALVAANRVYMERRLDEVFVKDSATHEVVAVYGVHRTGYIQYDKIVDPVTNKITWHNPATTASTNDLVDTGRVPYSEFVVSELLEKITEGVPLTQVCQRPNMPTYAQFVRWMKIHPWIKTALEEARLARAEYHRDKVLEEAELAESRKDPIEATKVKIDAHKWLAGVDDARYKNSSKIEANISVPTQIIVSTGIQRGETDVTDQSTQYNLGRLEGDAPHKNTQEDEVSNSNQHGAPRSQTSIP